MKVRILKKLYKKQLRLSTGWGKVKIFIPKKTIPRIIQYMKSN